MRIRYLIFILITIKTISANPSNTDVLAHTVSKFNGIVIDINQKHENFAEQLKLSLAQWKSERRKVIWLTIPIEYSELIPSAVNQGFVFHHAQKDKVVLTQWLLNEKSNIPAYATRTVGVWAIVIDDTNRILVLKEKYDNQWGYKFPSGAVEMAEDIKDGALREVKEETGIDTIFESVIAFCERHNTRIDNVSDISFICKLRPLTAQITPQESEVSQVIWMPYDEFKKIAQGPQKQVLAAYEANLNGYIPYQCSDFAGYSKNGTMTLYASPQTVMQ